MQPLDKISVHGPCLLSHCYINDLKRQKVLLACVDKLHTLGLILSFPS